MLFGNDNCFFECGYTFIQLIQKQLEQGQTQDFMRGGGVKIAHKKIQREKETERERDIHREKETLNERKTERVCKLQGYECLLYC